MFAPADKMPVKGIAFPETSATRHTLLDVSAVTIIPLKGEPLALRKC
jgi:hypothetical protein